MKITKLIAILVLLFSVSTVSAVTLNFNTQDFPPFTYMEDDIVAGLATELVALVCKTGGFECNMNLADWTLAQQEARKKKWTGCLLLAGTKNAMNGYITRSQSLLPNTVSSYTGTVPGPTAHFPVFQIIMSEFLARPTHPEASKH